MINNPNQFQVITGKSPSYANGVLFSKYDIAANRYARKILSAGGYKVYQYFVDNQANYIFMLCPAHVQEICDISKSTYERAIRELRDKEFLVYKTGKGKQLIFYEWPNNVPLTNDIATETALETDSLQTKLAALGASSYLQK